MTPLGTPVPRGFQSDTVAKPVKPLELLECLHGMAASLVPTGSEKLAPAPAKPPAKSSGWRGRILIAEDNPVNQRVASLQAKNLGFETDVVNNGEEALASLDRLAYTLVLMDCQMPLMDGYQATRELRKREQSGRRTPVIAMTANAFASDREACIQAGMDDFLAKPVNLRALAMVLDRWSGAGMEDGAIEEAVR